MKISKKKALKLEEERQELYQMLELIEEEEVMELARNEAILELKEREAVFEENKNCLGKRLNYLQDRINSKSLSDANGNHEAWEIAQEKKVYEREIKEIIETLEKIDKNKYGICDFCKEPIPTGRLKALPEAHLCVNCKERGGN